MAYSEPTSSTRELAELQRFTDAALAHLAIDDLLGVLLDRVTEILRSDTAAILLLDEDSDVLHARAAKGIEEEVEQSVRIPVGKGFAGRIAAERHPLFIADVDQADILNPILRQKGIRSLLGVPLLVEGRVLGVLHVGTLAPREFTEADADLLQVAADRAALAIDHAQLYEERRLAAALQRALLPQELHQMPGIQVAARYMPAAQGGSLGGDWYDVFPLAGGRLGLVVGDVVGRGVEAASLMAQLRTALRAYAVEGHGPREVVGRVNGLLAFIRPSTMTTAAYLVLDPETETLTVVNAGHPPPLLIDPDGSARYLQAPSGVPLGVSRASVYRESEHHLPAGGTIVLYTDGVVEVRGESLDEGLERLRSLAAARHESIEALCDAVIDKLIAAARPADDVALLAARLEPLGDRLATTWPAHADALAGLRHLLRRWLLVRGASADEAYEITVACGEAAANAIEHAHAPGGGTFEVAADCSEGTVSVTIRDHGRWRPARGIHRGRGLPLMETLMDSVQIDRGETGTAIVLKRALAVVPP